MWQAQIKRYIITFHGSGTQINGIIGRVHDWRMMYILWSGATDQIRQSDAGRYATSQFRRYLAEKDESRYCRM